MVNFREWLSRDERQIIDPEVLQTYEREFQRQLDLLIQRTRDPDLKRTFLSMKDCPLQTSGKKVCYSFTGWILNSLIRHGCHMRVDPEAALNHVAFRLLSPVNDSGERRKNAFEFDEARPYEPGTNPLEARLKTYISRDIRSICGGRIPRVLNIHRPPGTLSITNPAKVEPGMFSADDIPGRPESGEEELLADIMHLLRQRSRDIPLADLFQSMLANETLKQQRARFGFSKTKLGRELIYQVIEDYAKKTGNLALAKVSKYRNLKRSDPDPNAPYSAYRKRKPRIQDQYSPDVRDYLSILRVVQKSGGRASTAVLGRQRRRWLERKPRDPLSSHENRLADVLANMMANGVLIRQGYKYMVGPNAEKYLELLQVTP